MIRFATLLFALVVALAGTTAHAAAKVESTTSVAAPADVVVDIWLGEIDLVVQGGAKGKVELDAKVSGAFTPKLEKDGSRVHVRFDGLGIPRGGSVTLRVPTGAELQIRTRNGDVEASKLGGRISIATTSGEVDIAGSPKQVEVATINGDVTLRGANGRVEIATVSGDVEVTNARGELRVETVSGGVEVTRARLDRLQVATVSGDAELGVELGKGPHRIDVNSGDVRLRVPKTVPLRIEVTTFSGTIADGLASPPVSRERSHARELGKGGGVLAIGTFSGDVDLAAAR